MKKIFLTAIFSIVGICCYANDVIVTKNKEKLEGKIIEVSQNEIKYKKATNPDGPTFVIDKSEVVTILYDNGEVEVFKNESEHITKSNPDNKPNKVGKIYYSKIKCPDGKKKRCYHNSDNSIILEDVDWEYMLQENCQEAHRHYIRYKEYLKLGFGYGSYIKEEFEKAISTYNEKCAEE